MDDCLLVQEMCGKLVVNENQSKLYSTNQSNLKVCFAEKSTLILLISFVMIGTIGFILLAIGYALPMYPLVIAGWILVGIGYIPLLILLAIRIYINGILW